MSKRKQTGTLEYKPLNSFFAREYLSTYYKDIDPDEKAIAKFLVKNLKRVKGKPKMLELACGPTIHHLLPAVPHVSRIEISDYLPKNLYMVRQWVKKGKDAHDWSKFTKLILKLERSSSTKSSVLKREKKLRGLLKSFTLCDLRNAKVLKNNRKWDLVLCFYAAEEVGITKVAWQRIMRNISAVVKPGGWLFMSFLNQTKFYHLYSDRGSTRKIPTAKISLKDVRSALATNGFNVRRANIRVVSTPSQRKEGVNGVILACARKNGLH